MAGAGWIVDRAFLALGRALLLLVVIFLIVPALVIVVSSFSTASFMQFPPHEWGLRQYEALFASSMWLETISVSFIVAVPTAIIATVVGLFGVLALHRTALPGAAIIRALAVSSLIIPISAYALALYGLFLELDLVGSYVGVILADSVQGAALSVLIMGASIERIPRELELVAMTLGASRIRASIGITVKLMRPAIITAVIFAFLSSFDEATIINFLAGATVMTLPKAIFDSVQFGTDPLITAIGTLLMAMTVGLVLVTAVVGRNPTT
jgi:ABC-type spermidine/putrescine transport system permease subunit II